jgi:hypothetical protein
VWIWEGIEKVPKKTTPNRAYWIMEHALRWIHFGKLPVDVGYPMYVEIDNILPFVVNEYNKREKERMEDERDAEKKKQDRAEQIASDLAQMQKRR